MGTTLANTQMLTCVRLSRYEIPQQDKIVDVAADRERMDNHSPIRYQATLKREHVCIQRKLK